MSESFLLPIPGDFSGDGKTDVLAFAPRSGSAYYLQSTQTNQFQVSKFAEKTFFGLALNEKQDGFLGLKCRRSAGLLSVGRRAVAICE